MKSIILSTWLMILAMCSTPNPSADMLALDDAESYTVMAASAEPASAMRKVSQAPEQKAMIIRTANMELEVNSLDKSILEVKQLIEKHQAQVTNENSSNWSGRKENSLSIRIPAAHLDAFIADLEGLGYFSRSKNISQQDVTEEYIDNEARLKNQRQLEERFRELLKQAKNIEDILKVEQELNRIRQDIDSREGRSQYLRDQVAKSTVYLRLVEILPFVEKAPQDKLGNRIIRNFKAGWEYLIEFILFVLSLWPFVLVVGSIITFVLLRKKTTRKEF